MAGKDTLKGWSRLKAPAGPIAQGSASNVDLNEAVKQITARGAHSNVLEIDHIESDKSNAGEHLRNALVTHMWFSSIMNKIKQDEPMADLELEAEQEDLPLYKHHPLRGRILHWAVWQAVCKEDPDAMDVRLVLEAGAIIDSPASYFRESKKTKKREMVELQAVHLAAGWGCVAALQALANTRAGEDRRCMLNSFCTKAQEDYYTPLHDAAFCGQKAAVVWLLENGADPRQKNIEGFTALHWLAFKGLDHESDLEVVVRALIKFRARLDEETCSSDNQLGIQGIPMEIAALPVSNFPNRLMHLLAPSMQAFQIARSNTILEDLEPQVARKHLSVFEDLVLLCFRNMQATLEFAREIVQTETQELQDRICLDAQRPHAVEKMAVVFAMAPQAAEHVFQHLLHDPHVQDSGHHPISTRASLRRWMVEQPMVCEYQPDVCNAHKEGRAALPSWQCYSGHDHPAWHDSFIHKNVDEDNVEVVTKAVMMPNILTLDLLMSLAAVPSEHISMFANITILGTITCAWQKLVMPAYMVLIALNLLDWVVFFAWGCALEDSRDLQQLFLGLDYLGAGSTGDNAPLRRPICWTILLAGLLRDVCNFSWGFCQQCRTWFLYRANSKQSMESRQSLGFLGLLDLWHPLRFIHLQFLFQLCFWVLRAVFLWKTLPLADRLMSDEQQSILALAFLVQSAKIVFMLRVISGAGKRILSILRTLFSSTMREMLAVMVAVFFSIVGALIMVHRKETAIWVATHAYISLAFGEGDNQANFGLDPGQQDGVTRIEILIAVAGCIVFNIVLLNLLIAIFANEYDKVERRSEQHFQRERSRMCCWCLLALQKIHLAEGRDRRALCVMRLGAGVALVGAVGVQVFIDTREHHEESLAVTCSVSAALLAYFQVALLALLMQSNWFMRKADGRVGPVADHYLWICHRADLLEAHDEEVAMSALIDAKLKDFAQRVEEMLADGRRRGCSRDGVLNAKLDAILGHLDIEPRAMNTLSFGSPAASPYAFGADLDHQKSRSHTRTRGGSVWAGMNGLKGSESAVMQAAASKLKDVIRVEDAPADAIPQTPGETPGGPSAVALALPEADPSQDKLSQKSGDSLQSPGGSAWDGKLRPPFDVREAAASTDESTRASGSRGSLFIGLPASGSSGGTSSGDARLRRDSAGSKVSVKPKKGGKQQVAKPQRSRKDWGALFPETPAREKGAREKE